MDDNYHLIKTNLCKEKGIQLIHIFEDEWLFKKDIVKLNLNHILKIYDKNIISPNYEIKEINTRLKNKFLENHHIEGKSDSSINLGVFHIDKLISVMTFQKKNDYKLNRFCVDYKHNLINISVSLLNYFRNNYEWKEVYSYVDLRWGTGIFFENLGFELEGQTQINNWYFKEGHLNRYKSKDINFLKICDCGNLKYKIINKGNK